MKRIASYAVKHVSSEKGKVSYIYISLFDKAKVNIGVLILVDGEVRDSNHIISDGTIVLFYYKIDYVSIMDLLRSGEPIGLYFNEETENGFIATTEFEDHKG